MEENKNYEALVAKITQSEDQLRSIDPQVFSNWTYIYKYYFFLTFLQKDFYLLRRNIEQDFERCVHALEVRKDMLLGELDIIAEEHGSVT